MNIVAEHMPDGKIRLVKDFGEVPAGFVCDGASIPRFFWRLCGHPYDRIHVKSGVKHDYAYELGGDELMRYAADCDYRDGIRRDGAGIIRSQLEYLTLRIFGGSHFNYLNKRKGKTMKRLIMAATIAAAALAAGCRTVTVDRVWKEPVTIDGKIATTTDGTVVLADKGWTVEYFMFGLSTDMESMAAKVGEINLKLGRITSDMSEQHAKVVESAGDAVGEVAGEVIEAAKGTAK